MPRFFAIRTGIDDQPAEQKPRLVQRAGGIAEGFRHRDPFDMPRPVARSKSVTIASSTSPACWRNTLAAARISSHEIGLRFCGIVELEPRPATNGSAASPNSVADISITS